MVRIVVAGGTGNVAQEIVDALVATGRHDIVILSRRDPPTGTVLEASPGVSYATTDYASVQHLASILSGTHTLLSFVAPHQDQAEAFSAQKNLVDAAIQAGVKRFAPSEWISAGLEHMPWYAFKAETRRYLEDINRDSKVLEYCLFQPGLFTNYLTHPYKSTEHVKLIETSFDFGGRRMMVSRDGETGRITFTTVRDFANVVARAVEYDGEWPVVGGIKGSEVSLNQLLALGEKLRGPFHVDTLETEDLKAGTWTSSWMPRTDHPSIPPEQVEAASKTITAGILLAIGEGAFQSSDEWNKLLPDYEFEDAETFLKKAWYGKP